MNFLILGVNHKTADLAVRERVAFTPDRLHEALESCLEETVLTEVCILSTCNRTEIYGVGQEPEAEALLAWLARNCDIPVEAIRPATYVLEDTRAIEHVVRVAAGLDSMVLGEPQILGQFKSAFGAARGAGTVGVGLERLYQHTVRMARRIRTETSIGENPISVAFAAVTMARRIFSDLGRTRALLIGAGAVVNLVAEHLSEAGVQRIVVANRSVANARELADRFSARAILLSDIPDFLADSDLVITSTASQLPLLGKGAVESALQERRHRPMFIVDLAVPRDVEPQVGELRDVYLYTVDDLRDIVDENLASRRQAAESAEQLVEEGTEVFFRELRSQDAVTTLKAYRSKIERIRRDELARSRRQLEQGMPAEEALDEFSRRFIRKLMHEPSLQLKKAGAEGRRDFIHWVRELFNLPDGDSPDETR